MDEVKKKNRVFLKKQNSLVSKIKIVLQNIFFYETMCV